MPTIQWLFDVGVQRPSPLPQCGPRLKSHLNFSAPVGWTEVSDPVQGHLLLPSAAPYSPQGVIRESTPQYTFRMEIDSQCLFLWEPDLSPWKQK